MVLSIPDWLGAALLLSLSDELHTGLVWGALRSQYLLLGAYLRVRHSALFVWLVHETLEFLFHTVILSLILPVPMAVTAASVHFGIDLFHEALLGTVKGRVTHRLMHLSLESAILYWLWG
ncbi:Uncharacterized protein conserved in archaea [Methanopyrus kandleri AV19]|uniref:Uncharacterized protein conserved in archaea n=1 Tax=Methanopyrus kandleri (strain AV19 / DSM 6324 / JCM 9639 / NBRC 100938) TaxID=190192 RepID=Q8TV80_METKA|nr:Uncharacterized protein conserved in archaea [Methanopyrus kandleri AV19]